MDRTRKEIWILSGILLLLTAAAAVFLVQLFHGENTIEEVEVSHHYVYLAPVGEEDYFIEISAGIEEADRAEGSDTLLVRYSGESDGLIVCMEDALLADADGIIAKASEDIEDVVEEAVAQNVPVVFYDIDIPDSGRTVYIGIDNYEAGMTAMRELAEAIGGEGNVLLSVRSTMAFSQAERLRGCEAVLEEYPDVQIAGILENEGNELMYRELLLEELENDPSINAILCMDGVSSDAAGKILKDSGLENRVTVVAFDLTEKTREYLEEGIYRMVLKQDTKQIGYEAVTQLNAYQELIKTQQLSEVQTGEGTVYLDVICVTKENLEQYSQTYEEGKEWDVYQ